MGRSLAVHREAQLGPEAVAHVLELLGAVDGELDARLRLRDQVALSKP
jgi:hypothetical protein